MTYLGVRISFVLCCCCAAVGCDLILSVIKDVKKFYQYYERTNNCIDNFTFLKLQFFFLVPCNRIQFYEPSASSPS